MARHPMHKLSTVAAAAVLLAGCGGDDEPTTPDTAGKPAAQTTTSNGAATRTTGRTTAAEEGKPAGDEAAALRVAQQYIDAYVEQDAKRICALVAAPVFAQLEAAGGCVKTVRTSFASAAADDLKATEATIDGTTAHVMFEDSLRQVTLTLEKGRWQVIDGGK